MKVQPKSKVQTLVQLITMSVFFSHEGTKLFTHVRDVIIFVRLYAIITGLCRITEQTAKAYFKLQRDLKSATNVTQQIDKDKVLTHHQTPSKFCKIDFGKEESLYFRIKTSFVLADRFQIAT